MREYFVESMFGDKCSHCGKRVRKSHGFCPSCGVNLKKSDGSYGFLGREDYPDDGMDFKLPFGFNVLLKPLMKELNKQMVELDKEMKREAQKSQGEGNNSRTTFSIHIGMPGKKPMKLNNSSFGNTAQISEEKNKLSLPKIEPKDLKKAKGFPREEPKTNVRRLSDRVSYEIELPGVAGIEDVNIDKFESGMEVKAVSKGKVFVKTLELDLPLKDYLFDEGKLVLDFGFK